MNNPTTPKQKADEPVICDKFAASLGISGDGLNLDEIPRTLDLTPTIARPKGGHKVTWNDQWVYQAPVLTRKSIHGPHWRYPELPANLSDRPDGCPAHFKARQRVTTDFATWLHHSAGHNLRGAPLIVQFTVTDELRQPDLLAQMF